MTPTLLAFSLGAAGLILAATQVHAAPQCGTRDLVLGQLTERYGESRRSMGLTANTDVMELFASATSGSWTVTVTRPDGWMCLIASGLGFEALTEDMPAKGQKT